MNNLTLYLATVFIWGSTWLAITFQFGKVPAEVSVAYRFGLAAVILLAWSAVRRLRLKFSGVEHLWMGIQGVLLFGANYICIYLAESRISSGLVAVVFSLLVFFNIAGTRLFFRAPSKPATLVAAVLGVSGVVLIFLPQFRHSSGGELAAGVAYAVAGTIAASLGNLVSARNQRRGMPVVQLNTFGMLYGAVAVACYAALRGRAFVFEATPGYMISLGYLAVFGSCVAFGAYLTLMGRIGADRAGYASAAIPVVALLLSVVFEHLHLGLAAFAGIALCLAGNVLVLRRRAPQPTGGAPAAPGVPAVRDRG